MKREISVIGHKNPDTDSICSAIAYAEFKNRLNGTTNYVPRRCGDISQETKFVLDYFDIKAPKYIDDIGTQVRDMEIRKTPGLSRDITIKKLWDAMKDDDVATQPILDNDRVVGLVTKGDIAKTLMNATDNAFLATAKPRFGDIAETLQGIVVAGDPDAHFTKGRVLVGAADIDKMQETIGKHDMIILGNRDGHFIAALESGADCIILGLGTHTNEETLALARKCGAVIIETPLDSFTITMEISKSIPAQAFMLEDGIIKFKTDDYTDDIKSIMTSTRHRAFPVVDDKNRYVGTVSRRNMLGIRKKQVILVDHNERSQAVDNIDEAEVLEIIDHHKLGTLQTLQPIYFTNQPVGCTATIMYQMFMDRNVSMDKKLAGLLCAAIISDTLMFRSPTCTLHDKMAAGALSLIADINIEDFATKMFAAGSDLGEKSPEEIFYQDYKVFSSHNLEFGVGQISSMNKDELDEIAVKLEPLMHETSDRTKVQMVFFMLTNIKESATEIIYSGNDADRILSTSFPDAIRTKRGFRIDGLLSRKKQLIPVLMDTIIMREV